MIDALSGEKHVTVSAVKPFLNYITTDIVVVKEGDSELTKEMKERDKVDLEVRYSNPASCWSLLHSLIPASNWDMSVTERAL